LEREVANLVASIAAGVPAATVAPAIKIREAEIAKLDVELRRPHTAPPNIAKLRAALTLRAAEWKENLRAEPSVARMVLRRLIGPLTLHNPTEISPEWVEWETSLTTGLLDGILPIREVASLNFTSWNHVSGLLIRLERLRRVA
jgi:hypothetical protein